MPDIAATGPVLITNFGTGAMLGGAFAGAGVDVEVGVTVVAGGAYDEPALLAGSTLVEVISQPMAGPGRLKASLTIISETLDADAITRTLGASPDKSAHVGDLFSSRSTSKRPTGLWSISSEGRVHETASLSEHIEDLLNRVTADASVWSDLASRHRVRVFVGWFMSSENEGTQIEPTVLAELGRRSIPLDFDVYSMQED